MKGYTITDIGKVRSENQDCVRFIQNARPYFGVLSLCDGMGGANAGSLASSIALNSYTERITEHLSNKKKNDSLSEIVCDSVSYANQTVYERSKDDPNCNGMGTTLVSAIIVGKTCCIVNIGDSRAYYISDGKILQVTRDHSLVEEMVRKGAITRDQAKIHPQRNLITRALGIEESVMGDIFFPEVKRNDLLLLCSDGLSNTVTDDEILKIIQKNKALDAIGNTLLELALSRGAPDNVTIGILRR